MLSTERLDSYSDAPTIISIEKPDSFSDAYTIASTWNSVVIPELLHKQQTFISSDFSVWMLSVSLVTTTWRVL
jgi:hypothetical protein